MRTKPVPYVETLQRPAKAGALKGARLRSSRVGRSLFSKKTPKAKPTAPPFKPPKA